MNAGATAPQWSGVFDQTTGHKHTGAAGDAPLLPMYASYYAASDTLLDSHDAEVNCAGAYALKKSIRIIVAGTYRIAFDLKRSAEATNLAGRIYKNGVAYGTERSGNYVDWTNYSEDLFFSSGDTCELWLKGYTGPVYVYGRNFRLYGTIATPPFTHVV
jgi:hypothetical protein